MELKNVGANVGRAENFGVIFTQKNLLRHMISGGDQKMTLIGI